MTITTLGVINGIVLWMSLLQPHLAVYVLLLSRNATSNTHENRYWHRCIGLGYKLETGFSDFDHITKA